MIDLAQICPLPNISAMRHDSFFIEPYSMPFHELVVLVKSKYMATTRIAAEASDMSAIFDIHEDGIVKHIQLGPMDLKQLQSQYLRWPSDGLPETFLFMSLGYEMTNLGEFSNTGLQSFFIESVRWQESEAEAIVGELREDT
jgi:hypothetical protein